MGENNTFPVSHCPNCRVGLRFDRTIKAKVRCPKCNYSGPVSSYSVEGICPHCGRKGLIKNEYAVTVVCPHCHQTSTVDRFLGRESSAMIESLPPRPMQPKADPFANGAAPEKTVNVGSLHPKTEINFGAINNMRPGSLSVVDDAGGKWEGNRSPIKLTLGAQTFGRKSSLSTSDIQLPTKDMTISKKHFCIEMIKTDNGELQHRLSDAGSTNGTYCNEQRVGPGEIIFLSPGNMIRVGNTVFKFDII